MWLLDFVADLRYALRTFRRSPGFTLTAVLSLALGIGATSAIVTALDTVLWRPLPVADPGSLLKFELTGKNGGTSEAVPAPLLAQLRKAGVFADVIGSAFDGLSFEYDDRAERILGEAVTPNYFTFLGVQPILGDGFSPAVQRGEWAAEAVLSYRFWQRRFGGDPQVIGRTIRLNTYPFTIVGVSPSSFHSLTRGSDYEVRIPQLPPGRTLDQMALIGTPPGNVLQSLARLAPGTTVAEAEAAGTAQLQEFVRTTAERRFRDTGYGQLRLSYGGDGFTARLRAFHPTLYVLLVLAVTVLVIACVNVAGLLLARATARSRELAVRLSIGAGRLRLIRQMLAESLLLSLLGGVLALGIASWSAGLLSLFVPQGHLGIVLDLRPGSRVLLFTLALSVLTAIVFGLIPAFQATRSDLATALKADSAASTGAGRAARVRQILVVSQVAFSVMLLIATGVFIRTLADMRPADYRANASRVLLFTMKPQQEIYTQARKLTLAAELIRRVGELPGVQSVALAENGPLASRSNQDSFEIAGGSSVRAQTDWVTPGFFETIGTPRVAGRDFTANDKPGAPLVLIVNRSFARALFGDSDPLGRTVQLSRDAQGRRFEIVGVVNDTRYYNVHVEPRPTAWYAFQGADDLYMPTLHVRTATSETGPMIAAIRREFDRIDTGFPVFNIKTMDVRIEESLSRERMVANISTAFGLLALALAAVGLYGILAYSVTRRRREIGIRIALGSRLSSIVAMVVREGLLLVGLGTVIGVVLAIGGARVVARYLFGVSPLDLIIVAACAGTLLVVALAAICVPAIRASRVDPLIALRQE